MAETVTLFRPVGKKELDLAKQLVGTLKGHFDPEEFRNAHHERLEGIIRTAFAPIFVLNLETATPGQFNEAFSREFEGEGDTMRKAVTFFVNAVREAQIPISSYIMKNKKPRAAAGKKRVPKAKTGSENNGQNNTLNHLTPAHNVTKSPSEMLLGLFDQEMQSAEQDALWILIKWFKGRGK